MADSKNKAHARQGKALGKKNKRARYVAEGRRDKNKRRRIIRTLKAQPTNELLRERYTKIYGKCPV